MPIEKILHHDLRQLEAHGDRVTIVVVLDVVSPIDQVGLRFVGISLAVVGPVNHAVVAVYFHDRSDQKDRVLADVLNHRRVFDGQTIGQLHQHFRRAGFRRVNGAGSPVERLARGNELLRLGFGDLARVSELGGDFLEVVELRDICFVTHRDQHEVATFFSLPTLKTFTRGDALASSS